MSDNSRKYCLTNRGANNVIALCTLGLWKLIECAVWCADWIIEHVTIK